MKDSKPKILIAVRENVARKVMNAIFKRRWESSYTIISTENINETIAFTNLYKPILIIVDDTILQTGTAVEAVKELKKKNRDVKIFFLHSASKDENIDELEGHGVEIVEKVFNVPVFLKHIEKFIGPPKLKQILKWEFFN